MVSWCPCRVCVPQYECSQLPTSAMCPPVPTPSTRPEIGDNTAICTSPTIVCISFPESRYGYLDNLGTSLRFLKQKHYQPHQLNHPLDFNYDYGHTQKCIHNLHKTITITYFFIRCADPHNQFQRLDITI